jgi:hypothetical protein
MIRHNSCADCVAYFTLIKLLQSHIISVDDGKFFVTIHYMN